MENQIFKFDEDFIKNYNKSSNKEYILEVDVKFPKNLLNLHGDLPFLVERKKTKNAISLLVMYMTKKAMFFTKGL